MDFLSASSWARTGRAARCFGIAFLGFVALASEARAVARDGEGWQLLSEDRIARISSRPVPGTRLRELLIIAILPVPAPRLMALIGDLDDYPAFMPSAESTRGLWRAGTSGRWHIVINPPFVDRRDYCVTVTISKLPGGRLESRFALAEESCPPPERGRIRMTRLEGRWTLTPLRDGSTEVAYQAITDPAGAIPIWLVNRSAGSSIRDMLRALVRAAPDTQLAPCPGRSLGCFASP